MTPAYGFAGGKTIHMRDSQILSNERLEILANGDALLALKTPWANGLTYLVFTHLVFTPSEFIEKLVALIPPPRSHLVRWSGVTEEAEKAGKFKNYKWSRMLAQTFKVDVT